MTILFFLAYYFLIGHTASQAAPTDSPTGIDVTVIPTLISRATSVDNCNTRSVWNIVWSCLTTIFACTWVAMHPNIPGLRDTEWKILRRRLKLMLRVIVFPESVVYWAWLQYYGAGEVAEKYNNLGCGDVTKPATSTILPLVVINNTVGRAQHRDERWTRTHGFFAIMGGFMLCRPDGTPIITLTPDELLMHATEATIDWPKISEEEIWDRSKGDYLSKGFVVLQTSWFIVTCLARAIQRLPITELEIVALAFAMLNGLIYFFWFHKPLDVRCPIRVHLNSGYHGPFLRVIEDEITPEGSHRSTRIAMHLLNPFSAIPMIRRRIWMAVSRPLGGHGLIGALVSLSHPVGQGEDNDPIDEGSSSREATRIKTFFAPASLRQNIRDYLYIASIVVLGSLFGAVHLAAWLFQFPTEVEKWIWRISSLTLLGTPIFFLAMCRMLFAIYFKFRMFPVVFMVLILVIISMVGYLLARILLLILPIIAFRSLPPGTLNGLPLFRT